MDRIIIRQPKDVLQVVKRYANSRQENFLVITLDGSHAVIKVHHISKGIANKTIVHPRECFYHAIKDNAVAILLAHNHPSGCSTMSNEDKEITERLCMAGKILGFHVVDHIIFTRYSYEICSMRMYGILRDDFEQNELAKYVAEFSCKQTGEEL